MSREMKDSGIGGIGQIPENWEICPMKTYFSFGKGLSITKSDLTDNGVSVLSYGQIHSRNNPKVSTPNFLLKKLPMEKAQKQSLTSVGDFIFADTSEDRNGCGNCNYIDKDGIYAGYHTIIARVNNCPHTKYFGYLFMTDAWRFQIRRELTEVKLYSVSQKVLKRANIVIPPETERISIVHFLDRKCTAIDTAIEKTKKSIEKLEEYKKAVITKAVTKGINPNAKMKDAHFLWLTAIPENWGIYKLNHILDYNHPYPLGDGDHGSIKADSYVSSGIPFIRVQNLGYAEPINIENVVYITEAQNQKIQNSTLAPNDILFAKTGATIGKTAIMPQTISRANTTSHIGKITVDTRYYVPKYIFYALSSEIGNHQLWSIANKKATRPEVGLDEVKYIKLCIPLSVTEQKQIADFLDEKLNQINNAISNHANLIRKLEEYKKSLIYYAVTGKIDCRNEVI